MIKHQQKNTKKFSRQQKKIRKTKDFISTIHLHLHCIFRSILCWFSFYVCVSSSSLMHISLLSFSLCVIIKAFLNPVLPLALICVLCCMFVCFLLVLFHFPFVLCLALLRVFTLCICRDCAKQTLRLLVNARFSPFYKDLVADFAFPVSEMLVATVLMNVIKQTLNISGEKCIVNMWKLMMQVWESKWCKNCDQYDNITPKKKSTR